MAPAPADQDRKVETNLRRRLDELRIDAKVVAVPGDHGEEMYERSAESAFVLLPLRLEGMRTLTPTGGPIGKVVEGLPVTALVTAFGDVRLRPDEEAGDVETPVESELEAAAEAASTGENDREDV